MKLLDVGLDIDEIGVAQVGGWLEAARILKLEKQIETYQAVAAAMAGGKGGRGFIQSIYRERDMLLGNSPDVPSGEAIAATKRKLRAQAEATSGGANLQVVK